MFYTCQIVCTEVYRIDSALFDGTRAATYQCFGQLEPFRRRRRFRSQLEKLNRPQMTDRLLESSNGKKCESLLLHGVLDITVLLCTFLFFPPLYVVLYRLLHNKSYLSDL